MSPIESLDQPTDKTADVICGLQRHTSNPEKTNSEIGAIVSRWQGPSSR